MCVKHFIQWGLGLCEHLLDFITTDIFTVLNSYTHLLDLSCGHTRLLKMLSSGGPGRTSQKHTPPCLGP